jgi:hypothetical protein
MGFPAKPLKTAERSTKHISAKKKRGIVNDSLVFYGSEKMDALRYIKLAGRNPLPQRLTV